MQKNRLKLTMAIILAVIISLTCVSVQAGEMIRISSGSITGGQYSMMTVIGERILKPEGFSYSNMPGGGVSNVLAVSTGKADLGITMATTLDMAEKAQGPFKTKVEGVKLLAAFYPAKFHLVVTKDSGIKDIPGLVGKRVGIAQRGQFSEIVFYDVLNSFGIKKELMTLRPCSQSEANALIKDRHLDAWNYFPPLPNRTISEMMVFLPMQMISLPKEHILNITKMRKGYRPSIINKGTYYGQDYDVQTFSSPMSLIVNENMSDDIAYGLVAILVKHIDELRGAGGESLKDISPEGMAEVDADMLHPGAARFYREKGLLK